MAQLVRGITTIYHDLPTSIMIYHDLPLHRVLKSEVLRWQTPWHVYFGLFWSILARMLDMADSMIFDGKKARGRVRRSSRGFWKSESEATVFIDIW